MCPGMTLEALKRSSELQELVQYPVEFPDKALLQDGQRHEEELIEELGLREKEIRAREAELCEDRQRREEDLMKSEEESRKQMLLLQAPVEGVKKQGEAGVCKAESDKDVKMAKLTENDDIEAYLTTFERLIVAYEVKKDKWAFKLAT